MRALKERLERQTPRLLDFTDFKASMDFKDFSDFKDFRDLRDLSTACILEGSRAGPGGSGARMLPACGGGLDALKTRKMVSWKAISWISRI